MKGNGNSLLFQDYQGRDYEGFWVGPGKQYLDKLERKIISRALTGGNAILDIGAGFGRLGPCYISKYRESHMLEPATNLREAAERTFGSAVQYHSGNVYSLPFPDSTFDAAVMIRVFHHLGSPEVALREIHRVLKPGAIFVFSYSNKRNIGRIAKFLCGRARNPFRGDCEPYHESLFGHRPGHVRELLAREHFEVKAEFATGLLDKVINVLPPIGKIVEPSIALSRAIGTLRLAPAEIIVGVRQ